MEYRSAVGMDGQTGKGAYTGHSFSWLSLAVRLLITKDEDRTRPPLTLAKVLRLSRTRVMAFQPTVSGLGVVVGRTSGRLRRPSVLNIRSKGSPGRSRMIAPSGIDTTPNAREIPHSRPPMCVTSNAARSWAPSMPCPIVSSEPRLIGIVVPPLHDGAVAGPMSVTRLSPSPSRCLNFLHLTHCSSPK